MKTIVLVCSAGMSTSLMVNKMEKVAEAKGIDVNIFAVSASELEGTLEKNEIDLVLLGPQIKFMLKQFEAKVQGKNIPIGVIGLQDYGMMNGTNVLKQAFELMENK